LWAADDGGGLLGWVRDLGLLEVGGSMTGSLRGGHQWRWTTGGGMWVVGGEDGGTGAAHRVVGDPLWAVLAAGVSDWSG
jgi:hypothetical protein